MNTNDFVLISRTDLAKIRALMVEHGLSDKLTALGIQVYEPEIVVEHQLVDSDGKPVPEHEDGDCPLCCRPCVACCEDGTGQLEDCQCACG